MSIRVIQGTAAGRRRTPLEEAYDQFRLERQGNRLSPRTLGSYDHHMDGFCNPAFPQQDLAVRILVAPACGSRSCAGSPWRRRMACQT